MTIMKTTLAATAATFLTFGGAAFADSHSIDIGTARLDLSLDTNGDGEVDNDEIIDGNMAIFDSNGSGTLDAEERGVAEQMLTIGNTASDDMSTNDGADVMQTDFNVGAARLDPSLDTNGDSAVDNDEIIDGNMALFDTNASGTIDAVERNVAEQLLSTGINTISVDATSDGSEATTSMAIDFDVQAARLMPSLDANGDGDVDDDEIINGNMAIFDSNGSGTLDAEERGVADEIIMNN
jgi:hypothetical protein